MALIKDLKDKWFILPIIILAVSLLIRIYWTFINLREYPFQHISDSENHIIFLFFLAKYGLFHIVPNYWNGFDPFSRYGPGWHFLSLPLYYLTKNAVSATFLSLIQSLSLGFLFTFILGRLMKMSITKRVAFFFLFFANPVTLDYIQIGRYPELTGWVLFIPLLTLILWYKNHKLDKKFLLFIPLYASIILTHVYVFSVSSFLIISLFLIKRFKEKIIIILSVFLSFILTSFWWTKFFLSMFPDSNKYKASFELLHSGSLVSYNTLILIGFLVTLYFYLNSCRNKKKELLFYSPLLILSLLILTRLIVLIPVINNAWIMPYNMFFLGLVIYLFFHIDLDVAPRIFKKIIPPFLIILTISMFMFSFIRVEYSNPPHPPLREDLLSILPSIEGRYIFITTEKVDCSRLPHPHLGMYDLHVMNYALMNYNLSTPFGTVHPGGIVPESMSETFKQMYGYGGPWEECPEEIRTLNCDTIKDVVVKQNIKSLIASNKDCELLKECSYREKLKTGQVCLFTN